MRMSIGIPGISVYFEHHQVKPFIKDQSKRAKDLFYERVVPAVLRGTCKTLGHRSIKSTMAYIGTTDAQAGEALQKALMGLF